MDQQEDEIDSAIKRMRQAALPSEIDSLKHRLLEVESQAMRDRIEFGKRLSELERFRLDHQPLIWYLVAGVAALFLIEHYGRDTVQGWGSAIAFVSVGALVVYCAYRGARRFMRWALRKAE